MGTIVFPNMQGLRHLIRSWLLGLTIVLLLVLDLTTRAYGGSNTIGQIPSDLTFQTLEGRTMTISEMRNSVILLNFWGTWCRPCLEEIPDLIKLSHRFHSQGLNVIGVTLESGSPDDIRTFIETHGMDYIVVIGDLDEVKLNFQVMGFPASVLIDREGLVRKRYFGPQTEAGLAKDVLPLLSSSMIHD